MGYLVCFDFTERKRRHREVNHFSQDFIDGTWYSQERNSDPFHPHPPPNTASPGKGHTAEGEVIPGNPEILQCQLLGQRLNSSFLPKCMSLCRLMAGSSENQGISFIWLQNFGLFLFGSANIIDNWIRLWIEQKIKTSVLAEMSYISLLNINVNKEKPLPFIWGISACHTKAVIQIKGGVYL